MTQHWWAQANQIKWHLGIKYYFHFKSVQKKTIKNLSMIFYSPSCLEDATLANALSDSQHADSLFYSKILFKKTMNQSMQFTYVLWKSFWRGQICCIGCWGIWRVSGPLAGRQSSHPTEHTTLLATFPRHLMGGSISCLQRESKSAPHMYKSHFLLRGVGNLWREQQNPCGSMQGLESAPRSLSAVLHAASF